MQKISEIKDNDTRDDRCKDKIKQLTASKNSISATDHSAMFSPSNIDEQNKPQISKKSILGNHPNF